MPATFAEIASNTASVTVQVGQNSVTIVYYPSKVTEDTFMQLQSFGNMTEGRIQESFASLNKLLVELIQSWDLLDEDRDSEGNKISDQLVMYPLVPERLAKLPVYFRIQVLNAVMSDIRPETLAPSIQS